MPPTQLRCRDLAPGDILLKVSDGSFLSQAIQAGQRAVGGRNPGIAHAGLLFDKTYMIEAQAAGVSANDLRVQNRGYGYYVYRCKRPHMARGAGTCAKMMFDINGASGALRYNLLGALGSLFGKRGRSATRDEMDALLDRILEGRGRPFFCSQFVVYVYQFVAEQCGVPATAVFPLADAKAHPSALATHLAANPFFHEQGWLFPNER
jgi:hypothetical protein